MSVRSNPIWQLTAMRLRELAREPGTMFWVFGFPVLLTVALGLAFRSSGPEAPRVGLVQPAPEAFADLLKRAGIRVEALAPEAAASRLRAGRVDLLVMGPVTDATGAKYALRLRFDPTRPEARMAVATVEDAVQRAGGRQDPIAVEHQEVTESGSRYIDFLVPGLVGMNVMSGSMWGIGWAIANLRVRKLLKRLMATPMRRSHLILGVALGRLVLLPFEAGALLIFARVAFGVQIAGSLVLLAGVAVLGSFSFAGIGVLAASRAQNTESVVGLMNLVMLPMFILSGVFFSSARFPDGLQPLLSLLPLTALNDALRAVMTDGAGLTALARPCAVLAGWGVACGAAGLRVFRWG